MERKAVALAERNKEYKDSIISGIEVVEWEDGEIQAKVSEEHSLFGRKTYFIEESDFRPLADGEEDSPVYTANY